MPEGVPANFLQPYLHEWCGLISDSVGEYVSEIRDDVCLTKEPHLEVVVTGGSSAVEPCVRLC